MAALSLRAGCRAAAVLFDFANAFPALSHTWILATLRQMDVPPLASSPSLPPCSPTSSWTCAAGVVVRMIGVLSDVRQRRPLFGAIFVRWHLGHHVFQQTHIFLYADDLSNDMADLFYALPLVVHSLCHWSRASGLQLKPSKCIVLPLWDGDLGELHALLDSLPGFCTVAIRTSARDLGVGLGMGAADNQ